MAKLALGKAPESFKKVVEITNLYGTKDTIEIEFKYRTRKQYGELIDSIQSSEKSSKKTDTYVDIITDTDAKTVEFLLSIAKGWDLEEPFNAENVAILVDQFPNATNEINDAYRIAILEGRLKN
jgi:hypothetical protein